jgi:predicted MPP superfamily phosphohydrolase
LRFLAFISVFLTLYGLLHFYAFLKVHWAFALTRGTGTALACLMLFMLFCPVIVQVIERHGVDGLSKALAIAGYVWMGFLFLFVSAALFIDLYRLICTVGAHLFHGGLDRCIPSARVVFFAALAASVLGTMYGYLEAVTIRKEHITIRTPKIPKAMGRLRIVQVSDIHLGRMVGEGRLENILAKVREAKPDILISTGDLVDGQMSNGSGLAQMFRLIRTPYGKFAVMGNHEFYAGLDRSLSFTKAAGFNVLRGTGVDIGGAIFIAGIDDEAGHRYCLFAGNREEELLSHVPVDRFALLLKHRPHVDRKGDRRFDLQLSGHTHGGQIFPFSLIIKLLYPVDGGLVKLKEGAYLHVNRGAGTWGPPIRFLAPPEITIIDLVHAKGPG